MTWRLPQFRHLLRLATELEVESRDMAAVQMADAVRMAVSACLGGKEGDAAFRRWCDERLRPTVDPNRSD